MTKERIPIVIVGVLCFIILMFSAYVYESYAEDPQVASLYTYMEIIIYQPGFEMMLMDERGSVYSTYDYPKEMMYPPKVGDFAITQMQFEYVGNQLFNLKHLKIVNIIPRSTIPR